MKIENIKVNRILDSRREWALEVKIFCEGIEGKSSIPVGKSLGKHEAICLDCEKIEKNIPKFLKNLKKLDFKSSKEFDQFLIELGGKYKEKLGANFVLGASIAFSRVLAKKENLELWEYLNRLYMNQYESGINQYKKIYAPDLIINSIGGGVHSFNNLDFQEYWLITNKCGGKTDKCGYFYKVLAKILNIINKLEEKLPKPLGRNDEGAFCTNFSDNYEPFLYLKEFKNDFELGADIAANQITKLVN